MPRQQRGKRGSNQTATALTTGLATLALRYQLDNGNHRPTMPPLPALPSGFMDVNHQKRWLNAALIKVFIPAMADE